MMVEDSENYLDMINTDIMPFFYLSKWQRKSASITNRHLLIIFSVFTVNNIFISPL